MKKQVHYSELEDMQKYIKDFNSDDYERSIDCTDPSVTAFARNYYDKHLPVDLTAWVRVNRPDEKLIYGKFLGDQVCFVRDTLCFLLFPTYEEWKDNQPLVISTHYSKSVKLPIFQINLKKFGIELVLRYNFYDWKISIQSEKPLDFDYMDLFDSKKVIPSIYCEGFPKDKVYGSYEQNPSQFTIEICSHYNVYTFIFLLKNYLGID